MGKKDDERRAAARARKIEESMEKLNSPDVKAAMRAIKEFGRFFEGSTMAHAPAVTVETHESQLLVALVDHVGALVSEMREACTEIAAIRKAVEVIASCTRRR